MNPQKKTKTTKKRLQLNIRLTPEQDILIKTKLEQTNKPKTQFIIDAIQENPIYIIPNLTETLQQIKYLGNKANELSQKLNMNDPENQKLIQDLQQGCDELWRLLKLLKQEKPKQV